VRFVFALTVLAAAVAAAPALAGPPYLTDDPVPTDTGHWEIYGFASGEGVGSDLDADAGLDLNYGPLKDVQLTATLPASFSHGASEGWREGSGDLEVGVKYRFLNDERQGFSASIFPRVIFPTSTLGEDGKVRFLMPLWIGKDLADGTTIFGGGGYELNPGRSNRSFWQAALALTHDLGGKVSVGAEITRQGPDRPGGTAQTRVGVGSTIKLSDHYGLLFSGGPTISDHRTGYHFYGALGLFF
jgi:hypothetical protein